MTGDQCAACGRHIDGVPLYKHTDIADDVHLVCGKDCQFRMKVLDLAVTQILENR